MILFYRMSGFIADIALMAYTLMLLGLLYLLDATLTLPGVAGIILSIGCLLYTSPSPRDRG